MENEKGILARVKIGHVNGGEIAYIYEKKILEQLGLKASEQDSIETFMNTDDIIELNGERFKIVKIHTKFFNKTFGEDFWKIGANLYANGAIEIPFNFQITYIVDNVV